MSYSIRSRLDCSSRLGVDPYLPITTGLLPGMLLVPGYDVAREVPGLNTGGLGVLSMKWSSCSTSALLLSPSLTLRCGIKTVSFLSPRVIPSSSWVKCSVPFCPSSTEAPNWSILSSGGLRIIFGEVRRSTGSDAEYVGYVGDLLSSPTLPAEICVNCSRFLKLLTLSSLFSWGLFLKDSWLRERLIELLESLFLGLVNWKGLGECIERIGAVRGDGRDLLAVGDEWLDTWTIELKRENDD